MTQVKQDPHAAAKATFTDGILERGAVGRALRVLEMVCQDTRPRGLSEIARETGVPKATTYRMLTALCAHGMVARWDDKYVAGQRLSELVSMPAAHQTRLSVLRATAMPFLLDLYTSLGGFVGLGVYEGRHVRYVERLHGRRLQPLLSRTKETVPACSTAIGKLLLAFERAPATWQHDDEELEAELTVIRHTGIAVDRREHAPGMLTVAAPVLGPDRRVLAGVAVGDSAARPGWNRAVAELRRTTFALTIALRRPNTDSLSPAPD
ncbi:helix-turn-helix domain-containing protein [Streptomyces sp. VNUA116]|uniref:IclR family transcriptional regulator n=1 Tax=Streptomyces sp. VNUA116 TaxID=3062449 RepID=UPI0026767454|nr:helix-turn-helix domain-containing protein [Streptomyces sp. VNUA116]WKU48274.1 helix-turn-helix domain-containing protein [Streptomyces sp. VNUA116]